jgi:hypothetical protein
MTNRDPAIIQPEVASRRSRGDGRCLTIKSPSPSQSRPVPRRGLSRSEAATYLGISVSKFDELRKANRIAPPKILDGRLIFMVERLDEFLDTLPDENQPDNDDWTASL